MPNTPSIAFDIRIGGLVREGLMDQVDVDYDELNQTLDKLGEPEHADQDIFIFFTAPLKPGQSLGRAYAGSELRYIIMPIMDAIILSKHEATFIYDEKKQNKTLLHELQHIVDYADNELLEINNKEMTRAHKVARNGRIACYAFSTAVSGAFAAHAVEAATTSERVLDGGAIALLALSTLFMKKYIDGEERLHRYYGRTFEKRAYETEESWAKQGTVPSILKIYQIYRSPQNDD